MKDTLETFILFYHQGALYEKWAKQASDSFKQFHDDIDVLVVGHEDERFEANEKFKNLHPSIRRIPVALEILKKYKYDKVIISGVDIVTCHRYDEILDSKADIIVTYDYYGVHKVEFLPMNAEKYCNSDLMAFTSVEALTETFKNSLDKRYKKQYREQHGLNQTMLTGKYDIDYVEDSGNYYNLQALAPYDVRKQAQVDQFKRYVPKMYVKDNKLYRHDGFLIKSFHIGDTIEKRKDFSKVVKDWVDMMSDEVVEFLAEKCKASLLNE